MHFRSNSIKVVVYFTDILLLHLTVKMQLLYLATCVYFFINPHDTSALAAAPLIGTFGGGGVQGFRQQAQFGEGIRDWFFDMKDRIFGKSHSPDLPKLVNQAKDDYEHQKKTIEGFWLDLADVSFDPERDWGFHLGPWFIIKKMTDRSDNNGDNTGRVEFKLEDSSKKFKWDPYDLGKDKPMMEPKPTVETPDNGETTARAVIENDIFEHGGIKNINSNENDNATYNHFTSD